MVSNKPSKQSSQSLSQLDIFQKGKKKKKRENLGHFSEDTIYNSGVSHWSSGEINCKASAQPKVAGMWSSAAAFIITERKHPPPKKDQDN